MSRLASRAAVSVAVLAVGPVCGCRPDPSGEDRQPAPDPTPARLPVAPMPRPKIAAIVVRSVKPADDAAVASRTWVLSYGLTRRDLDALGRLPGVAEVVPARFIPSEVRHLDRAAGARVVATVPEYAGLQQLEVSAGRFLTAEDAAGSRSVCVLSSATAKKLFPDGDPVGKTVTTRGHEFSVVGVLTESASADPACDVHVPLATARARFGDVIRTKEKEAEKVEFHEIVVRVADRTDPVKLADAVRELLGKFHAGKDWEVTTR